MNIDIFVIFITFLYLIVSLLKGYINGERKSKYNLVFTIIFYVFYIFTSLFIDMSNIVYKYDLIDKIKEKFNIDFKYVNIDYIIVYLINNLFKIVYFFILLFIFKVFAELMYKKYFKRKKRIENNNKGLIYGFLKGFINVFILLSITNYYVKIIPDSVYKEKQMNVIYEYKQSDISNFTNIKINDINVERFIADIFSMNYFNDEVVYLSKEIDVLLTCIESNDSFDLYNLNKVFYKLSSSDLIDDLSLLLTSITIYNTEIKISNINLKNEIDNLLKITSILSNYSDDKFNKLISCFYNLKSFDLLVYLLSLYSIDNLFIKDQEHLETIKEKLAFLASNNVFHDDLLLVDNLYKNFIIDSKIEISNELINYIVRFNFVNELLPDVIKLALDNVSFPYKQYIQTEMLNTKESVKLLIFLKDNNIEDLLSSDVFKHSAINYLKMSGFFVPENIDLDYEFSYLSKLIITLYPNYDKDISIKENIINNITLLDYNSLLNSKIFYYNISKYILSSSLFYVENVIYDDGYILLEKKDILDLFDNIESIKKIHEKKKVENEKIIKMLNSDILTNTISNYVYNIDLKHFSIPDDICTLKKTYDNRSFHLIDKFELINFLMFANLFDLNNKDNLNQIIIKKEDIKLAVNPKSSKYSKISHLFISSIIYSYLKDQNYINIEMNDSLIYYKDINKLIDLLEDLYFHIL